MKTINCIYVELKYVDWKVQRNLARTGRVFSCLLHHLDPALEDSVGHSTCMCVLARRRAIMGLGLGYHGVVGGFLVVG